ncbi:MAG: molybdate ABC transporter permease subunit [Peptococcaceae bacterium]
MDWSPLRISLSTSLTATAAAFCLGVLAARWIVVSRFRWREALDAVFILPLVLPPTVIGFILLVVFGRTGPVGQLLDRWDIGIIFSWPATVIAAAVVAFPLMYKTARGAFEQLDQDLLDAARTMGSTEWEIFWKIMLPLAWPGVLAGTVLAFARAMGEFGATMMLAGNIPGRTQTIPIAIYSLVEAGNRGRAAFWVVIIIMMSFIAVISLNYWSKQEQKFRRR